MRSFKVQVLVNGQWMTSHGKLSAWLAGLIQTDLEYRHGTACRVIPGRG